MRPTILAMDLEGTLISNAVSQIPRPGLFQFLEEVNELFDRLVVYTTVPEPKFRKLAYLLVAEGCAPRWFAQLHYTEWSGYTKDLSRVSPNPDSTLLLDDYGAYVHPGQADCWVQVPLFGAPYHEHDRGLEAALDVIRARLDMNHQPDRHYGSAASDPLS
ncbi:NIF family HAD-type phosphatase [Stenotrophomonas lacuserhaii]|uniref:NIF family HAD-type phosphatase n=1 Tax=Stenotrophomonas lacuserhaii TaxID=2760084 RepID=UPI0032EB002A